MMAAMGYITPEITGKLPGFLSPSAGLKFADIPNGLAAVSKVLTSSDPAEKTKKLSAELANGRLAMMAIIGMFFQASSLSVDGSVENFKRRRATEIKHGRIAMLATMGYITPEITGKFPGYLSPSAGLKFADIPNGLAAISKVPQAGWGQILLYMAYCEVSQTQEPGTAAYA
ncbi:unnamed protein product, partial [Symbiodinium sp. CCMP2456]